MSRRGREHGFTPSRLPVALTIVAVTLGAGIKAAGALTANGWPTRPPRNGAHNQLTWSTLAKQFPRR